MFKPLVDNFHYIPKYNQLGDVISVIYFAEQYSLYQLRDDKI